LLEEPQGSGGEPAALYAVAAQLRAIGNNVKGRAAGEAAELVKAELRKLERSAAGT
jgi:hypothetical protein